MCEQTLIKAHLNESRYEESTLVAVIKLLPVIADKFPGCLAAILAAPGHTTDHGHGVLGTNILLHTQQRQRYKYSLYNNASGSAKQSRSFL